MPDRLLELQTLDWVTCRWLILGDDDMDLTKLFVGFETEEEMVEYFLHKAKEERVAVLASMF